MNGNEKRYRSLCERIREHCILHGADGEDCNRYWVMPHGRILLYRRGHLAARLVHHPPRPFAYPPATKAQLRATENALGYPLPPLLLMLYAEVANGGFGPSYGIIGARGGFAYNEDGRYGTIDRCTDSEPERIYVALSTLDTGPDDEPFSVDLPDRQWPAHCLHLAYDGCSCDFYLDVDTGRIYYGQPGGVMLPDEFLQRVTGDPQATSWWPAFYVERAAPSLEAWLEAWLRGDRNGIYPPRDEQD